MASVADLLSLENPVFRNVALWTGILLLKMLLMSPLTAFFRIKNRAFSSPEDLMFGGKKAKAPKYDDPSVERVRRAHRNDLENILPFILAAFFYTLTNPTPFLANNLVRVGALSRIAHTAVYAFGPVPQPTRFIAFGVPLFITLYMAVQTLIHFKTATVEKALEMVELKDILSPENELFRTFAFWSVVLIVKMFAMVIITAYQRRKTGTMSNPEDISVAPPGSKIKFDDPDVERARRAHRNDMENIYPYILLGFGYLLTDPSPWFATLLFRTGAIARIVFTIVYSIHVVPQPTRAIAFGTCLAISLYMATQIILYFL
ncbi:uncharacterized protein LOC132262421 [Phlebotomus argentipes]|uniref:uncharacterized protein LOC132262421 n=1 Tax=Phlebotomus argentipes TaxID=94469 RepID=UPI00289300C7|nr:uncharacterized protein LOC132262421 [Phlebotomus argentipes]